MDVGEITWRIVLEKLPQLAFCLRFCIGITRIVQLDGQGVCTKLYQLSGGAVFERNPNVFQYFVLGQSHEVNQKAAEKKRCLFDHDICYCQNCA